MKKVHAAVQRFVQIEKHGSSINPGVKKVRKGYAFENVPNERESDSGSKQSDLCAAAESTYRRAVDASEDPSRMGDQALRKR